MEEREEATLKTTGRRNIKWQKVMEESKEMILKMI